MRIRGSKLWHSHTQGEYRLPVRGESRWAAKQAQPCYQTSENPPDRLVIGTSHVKAGFRQPEELCLPSSPAPVRLSDLLPCSRPSSSSPRRGPLTQRLTRAPPGCGQFTTTSFLNSHDSPMCSFHQTFPASPQLPAQPPNHPSVPRTCRRPASHPCPVANEADAQNPDLI